MDLKLSDLTDAELFTEISWATANILEMDTMHLISGHRDAKRWARHNGFRHHQERCRHELQRRQKPQSNVQNQ